MSEKKEFWLSSLGQAFEIEWNPCRCHPGSAHMIHESATGKGLITGFIERKDKATASRYLRRYGFRKIGEL